MCVNPIYLRKGVGNGHNIGRYVPCGHCLDCLKKRQNEWYVRFWCEDKYQKRLNSNFVTLFLTLTYDETHLPQSREIALNDFRAFIKKIRRRQGYENVRFYAVTENGSQTGRLHWHCLLFGFDPTLMDKPVNKYFDNIWCKGFNCTEYCTAKVFTYVSKYVTKDLDTFKNDTSWKTISIASKRPSLGMMFFSVKKWRDYLHNTQDFRFNIDGYRYSLPRYFREKLLSELDLFFSKTKTSILSFPADTEREQEQIKRNNINKIYGFKKSINKLRHEKASSVVQKSL